MKTEKDKPAAKKPPGKVFDVSRPGRALASPTSRPVLIGHQPEAQDAQLSVSGIGESHPQLLTRRRLQILPTGKVEVQKAVEKPAGTEDKAKDSAVTTTKDKPHTQVSQQEEDALGVAALDGVTGPPELPAKDKAEKERPAGQIPVSETETNSPPEAKAQQSKTPEPVTKEPEPTDKETAKEPEPQSSQPKTAAEETAEDQLLEASSVPEEEAKPPSDGKPVADAEAAAPPEPAIEPLFDDSGVIVSHHDHRHKHHGLKVFGLFLVILLLAAIALDVALDLGLLNLQGLPHTDFLPGF